MTELIDCPTPTDFRRWLEAHHASASEVTVRLHKVGSGTPSITWPQAIEEALCFGWIDGVRHPTGPETYTVRFTPRRKGSKWSQVNIRKVAELEAAGRMTPAGRTAFEARVEGAPRAYDPRSAMADFGPEEAALMKANPEAEAFWERQAPSWRHKTAWWITSAKSPETRQRRMAKLVAACVAGKKLM
jgi:uncharacterized protein YdeI (YjbR/CyaY-like superfamily)